MLRHRKQLASLTVPLAVVLALALAASAQSVVTPRAETDPVPTSGDAADDPAIWVHPTHPGLSVVIGTDKDSGIAVYDLDGNQLQFVAAGETNNIDLRHGFPLGGSVTAILATAERGQNELRVFAFLQSSRTLHDVTARSIPLVSNSYGACMYRSELTGQFYAFVTSEAGAVQQWRLFDNGAARVDAELVRSFDVGDTCEGCVADDENGWLFVSEEEEGIWRYGAEPGAGTTRIQVDTTDTGGHLEADVEGLSIYYGPNGAGYLLASSQGDSRYVLYDRAAPHAYRSEFVVGASSALGIDGVSDTDGLDLTNLAMGARFPGGLVVMQDGSNSGGNQNFKLVDWRDVAAAATPPLLVDATYDAFGTTCPRAASVSRNGSGANPSTLSSPVAPRLGSTLRMDLDCAGHAAGRAVLNVYRRPASGIFLPPGELLVDRTSARLAQLTRLHAGSAVSFQVPIPADVGLCGLVASSQGTCFGAPGGAYSNALDVVLGW